MVSISRAKGSAIFPSNFILIAAMNPCPCGNKGNKDKKCICKPIDMERYERKISGPIIDRIDMWVTVSNVDYDKLSDQTKQGESTKTIKERVEKARNLQQIRFKNSPRRIKNNSDMNAKDLNLYCPLEENVKKLLNQSAEKLALSARAYHRVIKLARTIADLENSEKITENHILEALQYRPKIKQ
jgi:magnesium chelatase family protein